MFQQDVIGGIGDDEIDFPSLDSCFQFLVIVDFELEVLGMEIRFEMLIQIGYKRLPLRFDLCFGSIGQYANVKRIFRETWQAE
jgi:hypothetical protein